MNKKILKKYFYIILSLFVLAAISSFSVRTGSVAKENKYAVESVLSKGKWYKISIGKTGVYKLTYKDLKQMGLSDPSHVKVYGYGGWMLDEDFSKPYTDDLPQVSIWMSKPSADFNKDEDYILFYGRGNVKWKYNNSTKEFEQTQNPYSSEAYYFITESPAEPLLVETKPAGTGGDVITRFNDYFLHEQDLVNMGESGREFYGEDFRTARSRDFKFNLGGITTDPAIVHYKFVSKEPLSSGFLSASINGGEVRKDPTRVEPNYNIIATEIDAQFTTVKLQTQNTLTLRYDPGPSSQLANLNYIRINYLKQLKPYGAVTLFRSTNTTANLNFQIAAATSTYVILDVTDNFKTTQINTRKEGSTLSFSAENNEIREYALVDLASKDIPKPTVVGEISNQNLHALQGKNFDMVILVQPELREQAEELAKLHQEESGLRSLIVDPNQIYNEFSSGTPDVSAYRRFLKMFYDRAASDKERPRYLLLFGGGSYNNRFIGVDKNAIERKTNLLTYQSINSLDKGESYVTDDYLGFLGDIDISAMGNGELALGIGRIPVRTQREAADVISKIKSYMQDTHKGVWQNNITFVADDFIAGNNDIETEKKHIEDAELFSDYIETHHPNFVISKIYEDAYERVVQANGARYPDATKALLNKIDNGTLVLNFIGHGAPRSWTHEFLLNYDDIEKMKNARLPLWITATCDFSSFDANQRSGGEMALLNPDGGAIALFSTVRMVQINNNKVMNMNITKHLFDQEGNRAVRLGDIIRSAKSEMKGDFNKVKFLLLGDPAVRLGYADNKYHVEVVEVNGEDVAGDPINMEALQKITLAGRIVDSQGNVVEDYDGFLESTVFDAKQNLKTKGHTKNSFNEDLMFKYTEFTNTLFSGRVEIKQGQFSFEFTLPKDIDYTGNKGKMSFLAYDKDGKRKSQGEFSNYTVGGTNQNAEPEDNPPVISSMYLNTNQFKNGDYVKPFSTLYVDVSDDTGINLSNGIGHNMSLLIDGRVQYDLTPYFINKENDGKSGTIEFRLPALDLGRHQAEFRVWDVWNNSSYATIDFIVTNDFGASSYTFEIWGNPAKDLTRFVFKSDMPDDDLTMKVSVYSLAGRMVWKHEAVGNADSMNNFTYEWDLSYNGGGRLSPGVYVCVGEIIVNKKRIVRKALKLMITSN